MADQRLHAAERNGVAPDLQIAQKIESRRLAALELEREDAAGIGALLLENAALFGILETASDRAPA